MFDDTTFDLTYGISDGDDLAKRESVALSVIAALAQRFGTDEALSLFARHLRSRALDTVPGMRADYSFIAEGLERLAEEAKRRSIR